MHTEIPLSRSDVRRLAISRQQLVPHQKPLLDVIRDLGCVQLDPIQAVERTQWLVMWSRMGEFDRGDFERLMWQENALFEYWAHAASIVLTEDYPIHALQMRKWQQLEQERKWTQYQKDLLTEHRDLMDFLVQRIREEGPIPSRMFDDKREGNVFFSGWTSPRLVSRIIDYLWTCGMILPAHREGNHRHWDLAERVLPEWTPREELTPEQITEIAAQRAIRALGVANAVQIKKHFTRSRYPHLTQILHKLEKSGQILRVNVHKEDNSPLWKGPLYMHSEDLPLLQSIQSGSWQPRTTLLSPFDNLICDRDRTEQLWDFFFRIEIYVPQNQRQFGYYVLPILHGERLIGRIDPLMNRKTATLHVNAVYQEDDAPTDVATVSAIRESIQSLARFLGARSIQFGAALPRGWEKLQ